MNPVIVRNIKIGEGIPKICAPIAEAPREEILSSAKNIREAGADLVEWRADWYESLGECWEICRYCSLFARQKKAEREGLSRRHILH